MTGTAQQEKEATVSEALSQLMLDASDKPASSRFYGVPLAGVLVMAALLRLGGINFGLPQLYHWDEKMYFHGAFYTWATGGSTESLVYGNVNYLLLPVYWLLALVKGIGLGPDALPRMITSYLSDPSPFYLLGRTVWVGLQVLAVWFCYRTGAMALNRRAGLIAAAFVAVAFLPVSEGHYVKGDSTAMLGVTLSAWAALRLVQSPTRRNYLLLGAAIGLSIAFKFYTYTLVVVPVVCHLLAWRGLRTRFVEAPRLVFTGVGALLAFLVTLPAPLLDPVGTWNTFNIEAAARLASAPTGGVPVWLYYWTGHLRDGLGGPLLLCGLGGLALWLARRDRARLVLLAFPVLLYVGLLTRTNGFARYAIPLVPFLALAAGDLLDSGARLVSSRWRLPGKAVAGALALMLALVAVPSLLNDVRFDVYAGGPDTRQAATAWIEANIPAGASIVEDGGQGFEAASILGPPLRPASSAVGVTWSPTSLKPPEAFWREPLLSWLDTYTPTYSLQFAPSITRRAEITSTAQWGNPDAFVIISWRNDPEHSLPPSPLWDNLHLGYALAARFDCSPCFPDDPYAFSIDYPTLASISPLSGGVVAGPRIWVYRRR